MTAAKSSAAGDPPARPAARPPAPFGRLEAQAREIAALAAEPDAALLARAPRVSAWTVAQQLEHVGLTSARMLDAIEAILADPDAPPRGGPTFTGRMILWLGRIPRGRAKSRPEWAPEDASPERARRELGPLGGRLAALARQAGELAAACGTRAHPFLGQFDARRWLRFLAMHQEHHLRLVRDIRAAAGLPRRPPGSGA